MGFLSMLQRLFVGKKIKVGTWSDNLVSDVDTEPENIVPKKKEKKRSRSRKRPKTPKILSVIHENVEKCDGKLKSKNYRRSK